MQAAGRYDTRTIPRSAERPSCPRQADPLADRLRGRWQRDGKALAQMLEIIGGRMRLHGYLYNTMIKSSISELFLMAIFTLV
jgi:hypothetical protein